jgi:adenylosuccinate lyase
VLLAGSLERLALEVRLLSQAAIGEVSESQGKAQVGSSSMPHKCNPVTSEKVCGLARQMRGYLQPLLESAALWHERDISHSSVDRLSLAPACIVVDHMLDSMLKVMTGLNVDYTRMERNIFDAGEQIATHGKMCFKQFIEHKPYSMAHREIKEEYVAHKKVQNS